MITVYGEEHVLHEARGELHRGQIVNPFENAARAEIILEHIRAANLGQVVPPEDPGLQPILAVHRREYVDFLQAVHAEWRTHYRKEKIPLFNQSDAMPHVWHCRDARTCRQGLPERLPANVFGRLGYFSFDATAITAGTWPAARAAASVAVTGQRLVGRGHRAAFALTRPPGHHASRDLCGGYCYLNNAAIAAQAFRDEGAGRVAVLDVDYHHGNGTQEIFYERGDVLVVSLHADPAQAYPYYLGYGDERGIGEGAGLTVNYPLPEETDWNGYVPALRKALNDVRDFLPQALVVSLGVDTFIDDPISKFRLKSEDFGSLGEAIGELGLPTLFVMEGGYANESLGSNVVNVLTGFERAVPRE